MKLKQALEKKLTKKQLAIVPSAFDTVGDIAIFNEIDPSLKKKEKIIAETLLSMHEHIKVVLKKTKKYSGKLRTPKLTYLAGEKRKTTVHKENGVKLALDVEKCYFSTRSGNERKRIYNKVKKGESVLVMFSGVAPLPLETAKNSKAKEVVGIELNKVAHKFAIKNIELNKITNTTLYQGDVTKVLPKIRKHFDRIAMPLPKGATRYLELAIKKLKPKGTIHLYTFATEQEIKDLKKEYKKRFKNVKVVKCGQFAPRIFRVCLDLN